MQGVKDTGGRLTAEDILHLLQPSNEGNNSNSVGDAQPGKETPFDPFTCSLQTSSHTPRVFRDVRAYISNNTKTDSGDHSDTVQIGEVEFSPKERFH